MSKPFNSVYFTALEQCSPALYTTFWQTHELMMTAYSNGEIRSPYRTGWMRRLKIGLVRSFLKERRNGIKPRKPGYPNGFYASMYELKKTLESHYRER